MLKCDVDKCQLVAPVNLDFDARSRALRSLGARLLDLGHFADARSATDGAHAVEWLGRNCLRAGRYQEAGRLLDGVLSGRHIEVYPEDPVDEILAFFSAFLAANYGAVDEKVSLYLREAIRVLERHQLAESLEAV